MRCEEWEAFLKTVKPLKQKNNFQNFFDDKLVKKIKKPPSKLSFLDLERERRPSLYVKYYSLREVPKVLGPSLDLHGLTLSQAQTYLLRFIHANKGWVLLITGKGVILREWFVRWAYDSPEYLVGFTQAAPKHGGSGAFYLYIRKINNK
jgi:DNA-nicking Smr family endonuclease